MYSATDSLILATWINSINNDAPIHQDQPPVQSGEFDFLLGDWKGELTPGNHENSKLSVTVSSQHVLGGWAFVEERVIRDADGVVLSDVYSVRSYSIENEMWMIAEFDRINGQVRKMKGVKIGNSIVTFSIEPENPYSAIYSQISRNSYAMSFTLLPGISEYKENVDWRFTLIKE